MPSFFFCKFQLITDLILILNSYTSWNRSFISLKMWAGFSLFNSVLFLLKFIFFFQQKSIDPLTLKRHISFQNKNNRKAKHRFAPAPLIFKLQQEVWKLNDICVSCSYPKSIMEAKFWVRCFFSIGIFK